MSAKVFTAIKYIFLNHYRKWSFKDPSKLPVILCFYLFAFYRLWTTDSKYTLTLIVSVFILQMYGLRERKDFNLLKTYTAAKLRYYIFLLESLIINSLILALILSKSFLWFGFCLALNLLFPLLVKKSNTHLSFPLPFSKFDPLMIGFFRKNSLVCLVLIGIYYIQYQALAVANNELFLASTYAVLFIVFMILNGTREHLSYLISFNPTVKIYISKQVLSTIWNTFILLIPSLFLLIYFRKWEVDSLMISLLTAGYLCLLKYIFFQRDLLQSFISIPFLAGIFFYSINAEITWVEALTALFLMIILFTLAIRNFSSVLNNLDED